MEDHSDIQKYELSKLRKKLRRSLLLLILCIVVICLYVFVLLLIIMFHILMPEVELWYTWIFVVFSGAMFLLAFGIGIKEIIISGRHLHEYKHRYLPK